MKTKVFIRSRKRSARDAWLAARRKIIGASDTPAILGVGYSGSGPWSVWRSKVMPDGDDEFDGDMPLNWLIGRRMEPVIRELFAFETGTRTWHDGDHRLCVSDERPYVGFTPDGWCETGPERAPSPLELKNVGSHAAEEWGACEHCHGIGCGRCNFVGRGTPLKYAVQVQHQLAVTGAARGVLCALIGGARLEYRIIERDEKFIAAMLSELDRFWKLVLAKTPPSTDDAATSRDILHMLYPEPRGICVRLSDEALMHAADAEQARLDIEFDRRRLLIAENALKEQLGDAQYGALPDGRYVKWERTNVAESTVVRKAHVRHSLKFTDKLGKGIEYVDGTTAAAGIEGSVRDSNGTPRIGIHQLRRPLEVREVRGAEQVGSQGTGDGHADCRGDAAGG